MLKGDYGPRTSLYGSFEYDDVPHPEQLSKQYIERHGFTHPICGLVEPIELQWDSDLKKRIQAVLAAPSWSEGVKGAAMLLYLSLNAFNELSAPLQELLNTLEQNLFKLDERHTNIINFHMDKIEKIGYDLLKDYINYLIILYKYSNKMLSKYISIGLRAKDILYIGEDIRSAVFKLITKEKEKVRSWLEKQIDDLRIKDILLSIYMYEKDYYISIDKELKNEYLEEKIEDMYGKIKFFDKIILFTNQARKYFTKDVELYKICNFINEILKRETGVNFRHNFTEDYTKIINNCYMNKNYILKKYMFLVPSHIGLYLYYGILRRWVGTIVFSNKNTKKKRKLYLYTIDKIIKNLHIYAKNSIEIKLGLYLNKIESNNLPCEEIKYELIVELIDIIKNNYTKISEYFKDENKLKLARKVILSNIELIKDELRDLRLIELLGIDNKSKSMIIY